MEIDIRGTEKGEVRVRAFLSTRDPLLFQKTSCPHAALLEDNIILNVSFQFGTALLCAFVTYQILYCVYHFPLIPLYFSI